MKYVVELEDYQIQGLLMALEQQLDHFKKMRTETEKKTVPWKYQELKAIDNSITQILKMRALLVKTIYGFDIE